MNIKSSKILERTELLLIKLRIWPLVWLIRFLKVRKLNLSFHRKIPQEFLVVNPKQEDHSFEKNLSGLFLVYFFFQDGSCLKFYFKDNINNEKEIHIIIMSTLNAWPNYRVHGFNIINFVFRKRLSFLETFKARKILNFDLFTDPEIFPPK